MLGVSFSICQHIHQRKRNKVWAKEWVKSIVLWGWKTGLPYRSTFVLCLFSHHVWYRDTARRTQKCKNASKRTQEKERIHGTCPVRTLSSDCCSSMPWRADAWTSWWLPTKNHFHEHDIVCLYSNAGQRRHCCARHWVHSFSTYDNEKHEHSQLQSYSNNYLYLNVQSMSSLLFLA